jgi:hypothetical protein
MFSEMFSEMDGVRYIVMIFIIVVILSFVASIFKFFFMSFEKDITVKDKYTEAGNRSSIKYFIIDTNNNIYNVDNVWFIGDFNKAEDYNMIEKGGNYKVKGNGLRVDWLGWFPMIYKIRKL